MPEQQTRYIFNFSEQCIFSEIYFPKRAPYYGPLFDVLSQGYDEAYVKTILSLEVSASYLLDEFRNFPDLFNPHRYSTARIRNTPVSEQEAVQRMRMYKSTFRGWSVYSVDGVFFDSQGRPIEESVQVVRIIFRFENSLKEEAIAKGCLDVFASMLSWLLYPRGRSEDYKIWSNGEKARYLKKHTFWPKRKRLFAEQNFTKIALEVGKWLDDRILFVFAYLAHNFWSEIKRRGFLEEEIWFTNFYDLVLNTVRKTQI